MWKALFYLLVLKPASYLLLGLRVRGRLNLPKQGPAIIVANHNSHLDTVIMMALFPLRQLHSVHPVAAADYWFSTKKITWFANSCLGLIPLNRHGDTGDGDPLQACYDALEEDQILIFFPEGSRGEPGVMRPFRGGIARVASKFPDVPIVPVKLRGTDRAWPAGTPVIVPHLCDVWIMESLYYRDNSSNLLQVLQTQIENA